MHIIASGISHRSAPIDALGALGLARNQVPGALETLRVHAGGGVLIATCSRTEAYVALPDAGCRTRSARLVRTRAIWRGA